jgi:hypothetical protein
MDEIVGAGYGQKPSFCHSRESGNPYVTGTLLTYGFRPAPE